MPLRVLAYSLWQKQLGHKDSKAQRSTKIYIILIHTIMIYQLSNDILSVSIASQGAELQSILHKKHKLEYIWNANPAFWSKKSPVLFPIVGGLKNSTYTFEGTPYQLNRHGFAREKNFEVTVQTDDSITFTLVSDEESLQVYPFHFRFSMIYTLDQSNLKVTYEIENTGKQSMYFSVGAHPAFAVPLVEGTAFTDHYLLFSDQEITGKWPLSPDGLIETAPVPLLENENTLALTKELFYGDALVFKHLKSNSISIQNHKNTHGLKLAYDGFPYMGIWSYKDADFVCIEPWCGIADGVNTSGDITEKEGINSLSSNEIFMRRWSVELF